MNDTRSTIIRLLRENGAMTRQELARKLGLSTIALSKSVALLQEQGIVLLEQKGAEGRGRPSTLIRLAQAGGFALGISVKPAYIELQLVDLANRPDRSKRIEVVMRDVGLNFKALLSDITAFIRSLGANQLHAIGMSFSGGFDFKTAEFIWTNDFASPQQADAFRKALVSRFKVSVTLIHDTDASLIAERWLNAALPQTPNLLYIGARLGFSMMLDGHLVRGPQGWRHWLGDYPVAGSASAASGFLPGALAITASIDSLNDQLQGFRYGERSDWESARNRSSFDELEKMWKRKEPKALEFVSQAGRDLGLAIRSLSILFPFDCILIKDWPEQIQDAVCSGVQEVLEEGRRFVGARQHEIVLPVIISVPGGTTEASGSALWAIDQILNLRMSRKGRQAIYDEE